jgi:nucleoid-associated protein YgaU
MKFHTRMFVITVLAFAFIGSAFAQETMEMSKDEWQKQMQELTAKRDQLTSRLSALQTEVENLKGQDAAKTAALTKCEDDILAMVGATREAAKAFEAMLDRIDQKLDELARLSNQELWNRRSELDDVQTSIDNAKKNKLSVIPKYYDRLENQQNRVNGLRRSLEAASMADVYTVGTWAKDRDCLWNIAKKPAIYDNAFLWPKIWQGNRDQITNPDVIHPGQKLKIPAKADLTSEEKSAVRSYWQKKQAAGTQMD